MRARWACRHLLGASLATSIVSTLMGMRLASQLALTTPFCAREDLMDQQVAGGPRTSGHLIEDLAQEKSDPGGA